MSIYCNMWKCPMIYIYSVRVFIWKEIITFWCIFSVVVAMTF